MKNKLRASLIVSTLLCCATAIAADVPIQYVKIAQKHHVEFQELYNDALAATAYQGEYSTIETPWPFTIKVCSNGSCSKEVLDDRNSLLESAKQAIDKGHSVFIGPLLVSWERIAPTLAGNLWLATDPLVTINFYAATINQPNSAPVGAAEAVVVHTPTTPEPEVTTPLASSALNRVEIEALVDEIASEYGVDPVLVKSIIRNESNFNTNAISEAGAVGLMQLMPSTGRAYGVAQDERHIPHKNIRGGIAYLVDLDRRFQGDIALMLAAYNAGETAVIKHGNSIPPYTETVQYVVRVLRTYLNALESKA